MGVWDQQIHSEGMKILLFDLNQDVNMKENRKKEQLNLQVTPKDYK